MSGFHGLGVGSATMWLLIVYWDGTARHNVECYLIRNLNNYSIAIATIPSAPNAQLLLYFMFGLIIC